MHLEGHGMNKIDYRFLHDKELISVRYLWKTKIIKMNIEDNAKGIVQKYQIIFENVKVLSLSQKEPWGESIYINRFEKEGNNFMIEMQSAIR